MVAQFLTSKENLALSLIFESLGESRYNRSLDEYFAVAACAPKLSVLHQEVNDKLKSMADAGIAPYEICYFKSKDRFHWYEPFPQELSLETVRKAWVKSGMRALQLEHKRQNQN